MLDKSIPYCGVLMVKTDTESYPRYSLPEGYTITGYRPGLEEEWAGMEFRLEQTATLDEARALFKQQFMTFPQRLPQRCLFVLDKEGNAAATASLWHGDHFGEEQQRIHWVAANPAYQGKGLIKALLTEIMDRYNQMGYRDFLYLATQTWSYKAIHLYEKFGFVPYKGPKPVNWKSDDFDAENLRAWNIIEEKIAEYRK